MFNKLLTESNLKYHECEIININGEMVEIDKECIDMVKYFNSIGLKTEFSCQNNNGKEFLIIFNKEVKDDDIIKFLDKFKKYSTFTPMLGRFLKWARKSEGEILMTWEYNCDNINWAKRDYETFLKQNIKKLY